MKVNQLTARKAETAQPPKGQRRAYLLDGGGLYLQLNRKDASEVHRSWVFRYSSPVFTNTKGHGRIREMGLGPIQTFSLAEARTMARECRQLVAEGKDPIQERQVRRDQARKVSADTMLFRDAAKRFLEVHSPTWSNAKHRQQWTNTLADYAFPSLGHRAVAAVDGAAITDALAPIWGTKQETAQRVKQRIERVMQWVQDGMPPPAPGASKRVQHHPALPFDEIPEFMTALQEKDSVSARALEFLILNVARTGDVIQAKWADIDFGSGVWAVPDDQHKTRKLFEIPLSTRALEVLAELPREKRNSHVFIGGRAGHGLSNAAMHELLKGMHADRAKAGLPAWADKHTGRLAVPHGFRSSFRDWAGDRSNFAREVIEAAMSHKIKDKAEAAYRRTDAPEKRRRLMEAWGRYCVSAPRMTSKVVSLHGAA